MPVMLCVRQRELLGQAREVSGEHGTAEREADTLADMHHSTRNSITTNQQWDPCIRRAGAGSHQ